MFQRVGGQESALCEVKLGGSVRHHYHFLLQSGKTTLIKANGTQPQDATLSVGSVVIDQALGKHIIEPSSML
jgi:hypothetical protein